MYITYLIHLCKKILLRVNLDVQNLAIQQSLFKINLGLRNNKRACNFKSPCHFLLGFHVFESWSRRMRSTICHEGRKLLTGTDILPPLTCIGSFVAAVPRHLKTVSSHFRQTQYMRTAMDRVFLYRCSPSTMKKMFERRPAIRSSR